MNADTFRRWTFNFIGAVHFGLVAYWLARGVGIPHWRDWVPGDAFDIGYFTFAAVLFLARWEVRT